MTVDMLWGIVFILSGWFHSDYFSFTWSWDYDNYLYLLTLQPPNHSIWIFTHLWLCLTDAIHNFKWVKIIQIWQNGGHILSLTCLKGGT